jgi:hypothetical protein
MAWVVIAMRSALSDRICEVPALSCNPDDCCPVLRRPIFLRSPLASFCRLSGPASFKANLNSSKRFKLRCRRASCRP